MRLTGALINRWRGVFANSKATSALLGLGLLASCASVAPQDPGFRDTSMPLSVTTRGTAADLAGVWHVRAHFPGDGHIETVTFLDNWQGRPAVEFLQVGCDQNGNCEALSDTWRSEALGQNRFRLTNDSADAPFELWVIWVDEGFRTAAIGTPDGSYGWIIDRQPTDGEDRIIAAREILSFNGYDTSRLVAK